MWSSFRRRVASLISGKSNTAKPPPKNDATATTQYTTPKQPQPSLEVEEALRRSSLRGTNAARVAAADALERASVSLTSTVGEARADVERSIGRGKEIVQQTIQERSAYANQLRQSASEKIERSGKDLTGRIASTASAAKEEAYRKSNMAREEITSRAATAAEIASRTAPKVASAASSAASQNIKYTADKFINEARDTRDKALKWLWWWGLAAVGVYGFATSVPRELIRYASSKQDKSDPSSERPLDAGDDANELSTTDWKRSIGQLFRSGGNGGST
mmetsp:Transcript_37755/g.82252  ORF Transcript_37755/g.82252 Transcript_37755/m.82252 type:complete len:277 (-) Transcript_37755:227-1057(-)